MKKPNTILIVDDDPISMHLMLVAVQCADPHAWILSTLNPRQALEYANMMSFDFAFVDWIMPDVGGAEVLKRLNTGCIKIVCTGADNTTQFQSESVAAGAHGVYKKPMLFGDLLSIINLNVKEVA